MSDENNTTNEQQQAAAPAQFDPTMIADAIAQGFERHAVQGKQTEMTPEERAAYFQQWDPTQNGFVDSFHAAIVAEDSTPEQRAEALSHLRDGIVNQALRGAQLMLEQQVAQMQQQFAPALTFAQQRQAEQIWEEFQSKFPELADHRELVDTVSNSLRAQPDWKPKDREAALSSIAETAKKFIGAAPAAGVTQGQPAVKQPGQTQKPRMASTSTSPQGGAPAQPAAQPGVASFFLNRGR